MTNNLGFTLIELLVVVLIIAILGALALPKYMVARDRARLSGLMTIAKNVNDAMDRRSLFDSTYTSNALNLLDITFQKADGSGDCNSGSCEIKVSGKIYSVAPRLNSNGIAGKNYTYIFAVDDTAFGSFYIPTDTQTTSYNFYLNCTTGYYGNTPNTNRCVKMAQSFGASCGTSGTITCDW